MEARYKEELKMLKIPMGEIPLFNRFPLQRVGNTWQLEGAFPAKPGIAPASQ